MASGSVGGSLSMLVGYNVTLEAASYNVGTSVGDAVLTVGVFVHPRGVGADDDRCGGRVGMGHGGKSVEHGKVWAKSSRPAHAGMFAPCGGNDRSSIGDESQKRTTVQAFGRQDQPPIWSCAADCAGPTANSTCVGAFPPHRHPEAAQHGTGMLLSNLLTFIHRGASGV